eukprot:c19709_g1_i6.p1 GENE.c19709_g1_i6~~c19709_g1_i6.p1  ORF type:complete len:322 (+),score=47.30 c19709_g1_i6:191-1156(+)
MEQGLLQGHSRRPFESQNVDVDGNFSIQVLAQALQQSHNIQLVPVPYRENLADREDAFVLNHSSHWFTIRKLFGKWFDLNSLHEKPTVIGDFYLSAFLAQLSAEDYSIFIVKSPTPLPEPIAPPNPPPEWHSLASLLNPPGRHKRQRSEDDMLAKAIEASLGDGDPELAQALKMSKEQDTGGTALGSGSQQVVKNDQSLSWELFDTPDSAFKGVGAVRMRVSFPPNLSPKVRFAAPPKSPLTMPYGILLQSEVCNFEGSVCLGSLLRFVADKCSELGVSRDKLFGLRLRTTNDVISQESDLTSTLASLGLNGVNLRVEVQT